MEYRIKSSFYSPDGQYSGPSGRVIDEELYTKAVDWGYSDRVEVSGLIPDTFLSDKELDEKIAQLLAEKETRADKSAKDDTSTKEEEETDPEASEETPAKRGRPAKVN